jgi:transcriptional regulator with GAF, ATPase, and Fis domain
MAYLRYLQKQYPINRILTTIGRSTDNDICIPHPSVLPEHAQIHLDKGRCYVSAIDKNQQVMVNQKLTKKTLLEDGDEIQIGEIKLIFELWEERKPAIQVDHLMMKGHQNENDEKNEKELIAYHRLLNFSQKLAMHHEISELFEILIDEIIALTGADQGFLITYQKEELVIRTARNLKQEPILADENQLSDSIIQHVIDTKEALIVSDALHDTSFQNSVSVMRLGLCSVMCVPLLFRGNLMGVIYVGNHNVVNLFENESLEILKVFAAQASLLLNEAMQKDRLKKDNIKLKEDLQRQQFGDIIGKCDVMQSVFERIERVAPLGVNVLILGETGTGKELIARELHRRSPRSKAPFLAINCGALPEGLMESELFGHKKGAFTGAIEDKEGCFMNANTGTLFLDEIGEMPYQLQVKLLRVLQEKEVTKVGDHKARPIDVRLVCATHVNLQDAIKEGKFREDLYYRIHVVSIDVPPLRSRDEDVILIAKYLITRFAKLYERPIKPLSNDAILALRKYSWPGNIRELENRISQALILSDENEITANDLGLIEEFVSDEILPLAEAKERFQKRYIDHVLTLNHGNRTKTAKDLEVDPRTIFRHLEKEKNR